MHIKQQNSFMAWPSVPFVQVASYMRAVLRTIAQCHHHKIL
jgi:hypothetical protein